MLNFKNIFKEKINKKTNNENKLNIYEGTINTKDKISPGYINNNNPKYLEIDDVYFSGLIINNYNREYEDLILKNLIDTNINMNISIFYEKQDTIKTIRELTYHIGNVGVEIKGVNDNRQDIDIAAFTYNDAKYIRKQMQVNNEDLYFLYIYIVIFSEDKKELEYIVNKVEGILQSNGLQSKKTYFREEQLFLSSLPLMENNIDVKNVAKRNVLTNGLTSTYPFISSSIFDDEGIFVGTNIYNDSLIFIDRFNNNKYKNSNICIFGTSGARKIFFYKIANFTKQIAWNRTIYNRSRKRIYKYLQ